MLDIHTLEVLFVLVNLTSTLALYLSATQRRSFDGVFDWANGRTLIAFGVLFLCVTPRYPLVILPFVSFSLIYSGYYLIYVGCDKFLQSMNSNYHRYTYWVLLWATCHGLIDYLIESTSISMGLLLLTCSLFSYQISMRILRQHSRPLYSHRIVAYLQLCYALCLIVFVMVITALEKVPVIAHAAFLVVSTLITMGLAIGFIMMSSDRHEADTRKQVEKDPLTGALSRLGFYSNVAELLEQYQNHSVACIVLDLDDFKLINDSYGHLTGDRVLKDAVKLMQGELRQEDILGRFGGEEFVIMLPDTKARQAYNIAERIRLCVEQHQIYLREGQVKVTASIGLCVLNEEEHKDFEAMFAQADRAMYQAKTEGKNTVKARPSAPVEGCY